MQQKHDNESKADGKVSLEALKKVFETRTPCCGKVYGDWEECGVIKCNCRRAVNFCCFCDAVIEGDGHNHVANCKYNFIHNVYVQSSPQALMVNYKHMSRVLDNLQNCIPEEAWTKWAPPFSEEQILGLMRKEAHERRLFTNDIQERLLRDGGY